MSIIIKGMDMPKDGLYYIENGKIHKYKPNGGTVRQYELIEVVECKDCKWGNKDNDGTLWCEHSIGGIMKPTDFCSYGERKPISDERLEFWKDVYKEVSK